MNDQDEWLDLATEAARDPSRAAQIARVLLDKIGTAGERSANVAPEGYLYAGAHTFIARTRDLEVENLPTDEAPLAPAIFETNNVAIPIKIPFDCWIYGVAARCLVRAPLVGNAPDLELAAFLPTAADGRDLFTCDWGLDGAVNFTTDGRRRMMAPASVTCGTRLVPRRMSWTLRRNQTVQVRFRNIINAVMGALPTELANFPIIGEASVAFYAVNLESP